MAKAPTTKAPLFMMNTITIKTLQNSLAEGINE
jgi:hypothetical protein